MSKIFSTILALIVFFVPSHALSQEPGFGEGLQVLPSNDISFGTIQAVSSLKKGQKAPFKGILFTPSAAATMKTEIEMAPKRCEIEKERELGLQEANLSLKVSNAEAKAIAAEKREKEIRKIKDDHIKSLINDLERAKKSTKVPAAAWIAIGVLGGILITISTGYALGQIK